MLEIASEFGVYFEQGYGEMRHSGDYGGAFSKIVKPRKVIDPIMLMSNACNHLVRWSFIHNP